MDDALERYRRASEKGDTAALVETLHPDVRLVSPISGRMVFRGASDAAFVAGTVYGMLRELRWDDPIGSGPVRVLTGEARIGPLRMTDAMVFELGDDGLIREIRPHLRPWLALTLFALALGPRVARRPGVIGRALRAGSRR
jgi:hypothetical protein